MTHNRTPHLRRAAVGLFLVAAFCSLAVAQAPQYTISTFAGNGTVGYDGDGGPAADAILNYPSEVLVGPDGSVYISDSFNARIRKVDPSGTISTIAGTGTRNYSGDGGAATDAELSAPYGLALDKDGNLYFTDVLVSVVRMIDKSGNVNLFAGLGTPGAGGDGSAAVDAAFYNPIAVVVGPDGNIFITDTFNNRIRVVGSDGIVATLVGDGTARYGGDGGPARYGRISHPEGLAFDSAGNLYIADTFNNRIRKVSAADNTITTIAGQGDPGFSGDGGPAVDAMLSGPRGIAVDASGNVIFTDKLNNRVRMIAEDGNIYTIAGTGRFGDSADNGLGTDSDLRFPFGVSVAPDGRIFFVDGDNSKVKVLTPVPTIPSMSDGGVVTSSAFGAFDSAAPGAWLELYGSNLAARTRTWSELDFAGGRVPRSLGGTRVEIDGKEGVLSYVSGNQVNVQVPADVLPGKREIVVYSAEGASQPYQIQIDDTMPGLLAPAAFDVNGTPYVAALESDGGSDGQTYVLPEGAVEGITSRPAQPGETITFYGTGFGAVTPTNAMDGVTEEANSLVQSFQIFFGGTPGAVTYAGLAPGNLGLYQFNVVVPVVPASDQVPVTFTLGGQPGQQQLFTAIGN